MLNAVTVYPARSLSGSITLPGDESISHCYAMIASLADGVSKIRNFSTYSDCHATLNVLRALGVRIEENGTEVAIHGAGLEGLSAPAADLDAENSTWTIRILAGILAAQPFRSRIAGGAPVSRLSMDRILQPLALMGAEIEAFEGRYLRLTIHGNPELRPIDYHLPAMSAQTKACILFAGLFCEGATVVRETVRSRDHAERALREFGADLAIERRVITLHGRPHLVARELVCPSGLSYAAFFMAAALLVPGADVYLKGVGLNPTRSALLDFLVGAGADLRIESVAQVNGELIGDLRIRHSSLRGGVVDKDLCASLIDELPVLAVLGAASVEGITLHHARTLRVTQCLRSMGILVEETAEGTRIPGKQSFRAANLDSQGDERVAMACAVAALAADGPCTIAHTGASAQFAEFVSILHQVAE
jgi:3-phosphoshikimate 1-carboxyvinyltransferase